MSPSLNQLSRNWAGVGGTSRTFASACFQLAFPGLSHGRAVGTVEEDTNVSKCSLQFHKRDAEGAPLPPKFRERFILKALFLEWFFFFTSMRLFGFFFVAHGERLQGKN